MIGGVKDRRVARLRVSLVLLCALALFAVTVAPALALPAQFGREGSGAGEISGEPGGVAAERVSGDVYVADRNNQRVEEFGSEGEFIRAWGWGVADGTTGALQTCTTSCFEGLGGGGAGQFGVATPGGPEGGPEGIAVDNSLGLSQGDVYVVDPRNNRVQEFGPDGEFLLMFGGDVNAGTSGDVCVAGETCQAGVPGTGPGEFEALGGRSVAVDSTGMVYVGDEGRVQRFDAAGVVQGETTLAAGAGRIENLAVDSAKDLYVESTELPGVRKYDLGGVESPPTRDEAGEGEKAAMTVGPGDELFLNDIQGESHHIFAFDAGGAQTASFDAGARVLDGHHGIAYSEFAKAIYVLNEGAVRIVTPPPPGPLVLAGSEAAMKVESASATLEATVNPEGPAGTEYHFEYDTVPYAEGEAAHGHSTPATPLQGGELEFVDQPASAPITGLRPDMTYHFRVVATNGTQTTVGPDETFTTLPPVSIGDTSASQVRATSARLEAELNPHGLPSEYHFEYITDAGFTANGESFVGAAKPVLVPSPPGEGNAGSGTSVTSVENVIQELLPSTTYHYRVVAHNALNGPGEQVEGHGRAFTTQGAASILADNRAWELVSPPDKHGSPLEPLTEEGGLIQAAAGGGGVAYVSLGPIEGEPAGVRSPSDSQLLSVRSATGWSTRDISTPHEEISRIHVSVPSEYKFFSEDLAESAVEPEGATPLSAQTTERTPYVREADGAFAALVTAANVPPGTPFGGKETEATFGKSGAWTGGVQFLTATPDLSHIVLTSPQVLAAGFEPGFHAQVPNVYELSGGALQLVSVLPDNKPAAEAGLAAGVGNNNVSMRGAISDDGSRVAFETNFGQHLYLRDTTLEQTVQLDEPQPGAAGGEGKAIFQAANSDDGKVFFTDVARLTLDSTAVANEPDLYMCEVSAALSAGERDCGRHLTDLSVDSNVGEAANVQGEVSAIDTSATHVYFAANGVLTSTPNARGEVAVPGVCNSPEESTCNLYVYDTDTHRIGLVAVLSNHDDPDWAGVTNLAGLGNLTARTSPDGHYFTFMSQRSLTGYDNRDVHSGAADEEVFLYDAETGGLSCVSCDPTGARPEGVLDTYPSFPGLLVDHPHSWRGRTLAASIPGWTLGPSHVVALYQSRYLSDSGRMFFDANDALVPQDTNGTEDVYEFEPVGGTESGDDCSSASGTFSAASGGCVNLISSGTAKEESAFLDASESGDEAFFLTQARLTTSDVDGAFDVYDAHVCTAESPCPPPPAPPAPACNGDACQNPVAAPSDQTPGSLTFHGPGNLTPATAVVKAKARPLTRAQKLAKALKACRKKARPKRGGCEKAARKRYGPVKRAKKKGK